MPWITLYALVEGQTERKFTETVIKSHLTQFEVDMLAVLVTTNRKAGNRGGVLSYSHVKNDLLRRMKQDRRPEARFTTMFDLYGLPTNFPGWQETQRASTPQEKVNILEAALQNDLNEPRFIPYIQLHEFESLLYCDLSQLTQRIHDSRRPLETLAQEVSGIAPEDINEGETTAPSKRIIQHVPLYKKVKVRVGATAVAAIGLPVLRANCPHFDGWITQLEHLSAQG